MTKWEWLLLALAVTLLVYAVLVLALVLAGRRGDARDPDQRKRSTHRVRNPPESPLGCAPFSAPPHPFTDDRHGAVRAHHRTLVWLSEGIRPKRRPTLDLVRPIARVKAARPPVVPREVVCPGCGEPFMATGRWHYCEKPGCRPTGDRGAKVTVSCAWCGREFEARARDRARGGGRFCCKSHALQGRNSPAAAA